MHYFCSPQWKNHDCVLLPLTFPDLSRASNCFALWGIETSLLKSNVTWTRLYPDVRGGIGDDGAVLFKCSFVDIQMYGLQTSFSVLTAILLAPALLLANLLSAYRHFWIGSLISHIFHTHQPRVSILWCVDNS